MQKRYEKNILLNSGAGTGKTTFMRESIKEYLNVDGNSQKDILGVTFTNKAGYHMKSGLKEYKDIEISSLHKYFYPRVEYRDIIPGDVLEELMEITLAEVNRSLASLNLKIKKGDLHSLLNSWRTFCAMQVLDLPSEEKGEKGYYNLRKMMSSLGSLGVYVRKKAKGDKNKRDYYVKAITEIVKLISMVYELNYVTFDDIILQGVFYTDHSLKYILIDEFQDLTYMEFVSIITLSKNAKFLILIDEFQGIYQWRNSSVTYNLKALFRQLPDIDMITLETNYRSGMQINRLASKFTGRGNISNYRDIEGEVKVLENSNYLESILNIVNKNVEMKKDTAILCQTNVECSAVANYLKVNEVKNLEHKVRDFHSECEPVRMFIKILDFITKTHSTPRIKALLSDKSFARKYNGGIIESLQLLKGITAEQIVLGEYSIQNQYSESRREVDLQGIKYVIFDVESTGIDSNKDDIIQIAGCKVDSAFNVIEEIEVYLKTDKFNNEAFKVHNITEEYLNKHGMEPEEALNMFNDFINGCILVGHNVEYDVRIFETNCIRSGISPLISYTIDTLDLARNLLPNRLSYKLGNLNEELKLGANPNHNAKEDVFATVKLFEYLAREIAKRDKPSKEVIDYYGKVMKDVNRWWSDDLMAFYSNIENDFGMGNNDLIFTLLFRETLGKLISTGKSYKQISDFFTLQDTIDEENSSVTVSTIHQSKGLEYDTVIYIQTMDSPDKIIGRERTNVDYVTITRAKDNFYIIPKCRKSNIAKAILEVNKEGIKAFT